MAHTDIAPDPRSSTVPVDGGSGGLLSRAEPKVKAAAVAALLTPIALFYADGLAGGLHLPQVLLVVIDAVLTGAVTFGVGYAAKAADRLDLFLKPQLAAAEQKVKAGAERVIGERAADELETWLGGVAHQVTGPLVAVGEQALETVAAAAAAGSDPLVAARGQAPAVLAAVRAAQAAALAAAESAASPLSAAVTGELPAIVTAAAAADPAVLRAKLQELIDLLAAPAEVDPAVVRVSSAAPVTSEIPVQTASIPVQPPAVDAVATVGLPPVPGSLPAPG